MVTHNFHWLFPKVTILLYSSSAHMSFGLLGCLADVTPSALY